MPSCILQEAPDYSLVLQCPPAYTNRHLLTPLYCLYAPMPSCILPEAPVYSYTLPLTPIGSSGLPNTAHKLLGPPAYSRRLQCTPLYSYALLLTPIGSYLNYQISICWLIQLNVKSLFQTLVNSCKGCHNLKKRNNLTLPQIWCRFPCLRLINVKNILMFI